MHDGMIWGMGLGHPLGLVVIARVKYEFLESRPPLDNVQHQLLARFGCDKLLAHQRSGRPVWCEIRRSVREMVSVFPFSSLTRCRHCFGHGVARQAAHCPHCQGPGPGVWSFPADYLRLFIHNPLAPLVEHIVPLLFVIIILAVLLGSLGRP